ncbi:MAG: hypothetical protein K5771_01680 [Oscillospiraceae bacterium]|nr:hypothetical protein [Oscillospiraceae bacterium]
MAKACNNCEFYNPELTKQTIIFNPGTGCEYMKRTGRYAIAVKGNCTDFKPKNNDKEIKNNGVHK